MRSSHRGTGDGVGSRVGSDPRRQNTGTRSIDIENGSVVGVRGLAPAAVDSTDSDGVGSRSRRSVGGVASIIASSNDTDDTRGVSRLDGAVESRRKATPQRHADSRLGSPLLRLDVVNGPVVAIENNRGRT